MAGGIKSSSKLLAAAAFAGASTLIFQGAVEQHNESRDIIFRDLFRGAQLVAIFVLLVLSILVPDAPLPNITALLATIALRFVDLMSTKAELAAVAGTGVVLLEALTLLLTST